MSAPKNVGLSGWTLRLAPHHCVGIDVAIALFAVWLSSMMDGTLPTDASSKEGNDILTHEMAKWSTR